MGDGLLVICKHNGKSVDLLIPRDIPVDQLIVLLHQTLQKPVIHASFIRSENPIRLLAGSIPVSSFGLHDGSILYIQ